MGNVLDPVLICLHYRFRVLWFALCLCGVLYAASALANSSFQWPNFPDSVVPEVPFDLRLRRPVHWGME